MTLWAGIGLTLQKLPAGAGPALPAPDAPGSLEWALESTAVSFTHGNGFVDLDDATASNLRWEMGSGWMPSEQLESGLWLMLDTDYNPYLFPDGDTEGIRISYRLSGTPWSETTVDPKTLTVDASVDEAESTLLGWDDDAPLLGFTDGAPLEFA